MTKKSKRRLFNVVFLIVILFFTYHILFKKQDLPRILHYMKRADIRYLAIGMVLVILYVCSESVVIHYLMRTIKQKISLLKCIKYSFIGFFYSAVTPSSTGGQPMQIYYMNRDGINIAISTLILIIVTAVYKLVLLFLGIVFGIAEWELVSKNLGGFGILLIIGLLANAIFIVFLFIIIFKQSFAKRIIGNSIIWLGRHRIIKNWKKTLKRVLGALRKYEKGAAYLKKNKMVLVVSFAITLFQRLCMFIVTYFVYKSFHLHGTSIYQVIAIQTMLALAVDVLPIPGGIGISESSFLVMYDSIFGNKFVLPGMLLSRGITYYGLVIMSAAVTLYAHITCGRKQKLKKVVGDK